MLYELLFRHFLYPLYEGRIKGRHTFDYYREYLANQEKSRDDLDALQLSKLQALLTHCYEQVDYYKTEWDSIGFHPKDLNKVSEIEQLPLLTKEKVRNHYDRLVANNFRGKNLKKTTGGSTGTPFAFEHNRENYDRRQGVIWRGYGWSGSRLGQKTLYLWGGPIGALDRKANLKDTLYHRAFNRKIVNVFNLSNKNIHSYIDEIIKFKAEGIVAYTGPMCDIAKYVLENNIELPRPQWIISGAEPLFPAQRELIEKAFKAPIYNTYGCREFTLIAAECKKQNGLHINMDHLVVEVTDNHGHATSDMGNIVITDLTNYGMPLVRYINGDVGNLKPGQCDCGLPFPMFEKIEGRRLDRITTADGNMIPGEFFPHMFKDIKGIEKFQVVQEALSGITIKIIKGSEFQAAETENYVRENVAGIAGNHFKVDFEYVNEIELTLTGKHRVTLSKITPELTV